MNTSYTFPPRTLVQLLRSGPCALVVAAATASPSTATPQVSAPTPGSLLIFPEYDNRTGSQSLITVTNTNAFMASGTVAVEFVYIASDNCHEFNRTEQLTPRDTLTLLSSFHNFDSSRGFLYVFAKRNGQAISFNHLAGHYLAIDGISSFEYSLNPLSLRAISAEGTITDADGDGRRDMNGVEYEGVADRIHIPRFFGQDASSEGPLVQSDLILLTLAAGAAFTTTIYFQSFNDNEETFSTTRSFFCWDRVRLVNLSPVFTDLFLRSFSNHDPLEVQGFSGPETGWFWMDGVTATSSSDVIDDPAFLGVLIERFDWQSASDLPFGAGHQSGEVLNTSPFSDL